MAQHEKRKPKSLVLSGNGINCELETAHANRLVGFDADIVHINTLMEGARTSMSTIFSTFPAASSTGTIWAPAKAQAVKWRYQRIEDSENRFVDELIQVRADGKSSSASATGFSFS